MGEWTIGIIGGSGLYGIDALEDAQWLRIDTPWGAPSDELLTGAIEGVRFVFLPRHGRGHRIPPPDAKTPWGKEKGRALRRNAFDSRPGPLSRSPKGQDHRSAQA